MSQAAFDLTSRFVGGLPAPAPRWTGFPRFNFVGGHNDPDRIPVDALAEAAATVLRREGTSLAMYNLAQGPQGHNGLRRFLADKLSRHRGITCTPEDVLVTSGSGQGIDLVSRLLVSPGDTVIAEEYSYAGAINRFRNLGATVVGAKLDADGIDTDALAAQLDALTRNGTLPKLIYTIPTVQNPTGSIMPLARRHALLDLARKHGVPVFEDECYADLLWSRVDTPPALYALDPNAVVHIGSFSKSLAPALRVGYAVAPWPVLSRLIACKNDSGTAAIEQMIIAEYFSKHFEAHVEGLSGTLREKLGVMVEAVEREFGTVAELWVPKGGIFLWIKLPDTVDVRTLVKPAADAGIAFNPGPEWACDAEASRSYLRLCFGLASKQEIIDGVAAFARVCFEETGLPVHSDNRANA